MKLENIISAIKSTKFQNGDIVFCDNFLQNPSQLTITEIISDNGKTLRIKARYMGENNSVIGPANYFKRIRK